MTDKDNWCAMALCSVHGGRLLRFDPGANTFALRGCRLGNDLRVIVKPGAFGILDLCDGAFEACTFAFL